MRLEGTRVDCRDRIDGVDDDEGEEEGGIRRTTIMAQLSCRPPLTVGERLRVGGHLRLSIISKRKNYGKYEGSLAPLYKPCTLT